MSGIKKCHRWHLGSKEMSRKQELQHILDILEQFTIGHYEYRNESYQENVSSKIHNRLEKLGESLKLQGETLLAEKEATKALITDISHQLKTPLSGLKTSQSILQEEELTQSERREFVELMGRQISHLENLTEALVNISRMEVGMIAIQMEKADIAETIKAAAWSLRIKAAQKGMEIHTDGLFPYWLEHDRKWTKEALSNILDNAVKYSPEGTRIEIVMEKSTFFLRIEIKDQGMGIPVGEYGQIFKRFYRGKAAGVREKEGSGVGLYLTRKIMEEQKGVVTVKNGKEGIGSVFVVQLPLSQG